RLTRTACMRVAIHYARRRLEVDIDRHRLIGQYHGPKPLADPVAAVRQAMEAPFGFPPLRRALTPDDHVVVLVDEQLPRLAELGSVVLEHITSAGVDAANVTLLCPPSGSSHPWIDELPDEFGDVHVEDHDPKSRQKLAYLATTRAGRRLYLNRSL